MFMITIITYILYIHIITIIKTYVCYNSDHEHVYIMFKDIKFGFAWHLTVLTACRGGTCKPVLKSGQLTRGQEKPINGHYYTH